MSKSPPVFRWEQCYRIGNKTHWALKDTETDADGAPARVSSSYMVLAHSDPNGFDGRPLNEQFLPALIVQLLNEHYAKSGSVQHPVRVQLSRKKGWKKPDNTIVTSKPSIWGNPFWKGTGCRMTAAWSFRCVLDFELFSIKFGSPVKDPHMRRIAERLHELRGKNLACWCPLGIPQGYCHADILLKYANRPITSDQQSPPVPGLSIP